MGLLIDHSPMGAAKQDQRNTGLCDAVQLSDAGLGHGAAKLADFGDFFCAEKLLEHGNAADIDGVLSIGSVINPLKIGHNVVGFDAINVVDHRKIVGILDECERHQSVDMNGFGLAVTKQIDVSVSKFVRSGSQDLPINYAGLESVADAIEATNTAKIAYFVKVSEICERNRSPFFGESDIHLAGRPSGRSGLMIKDPPNVDAIGGSAVMARLPEFYNLT